ncbi:MULTISPECIES: hypothetical protein [unclassified Streptomyces]|uniref:hypothetical protein n=1 Tax=unclassified Streptomyces TaxID=2593676 RepID=UPI001BEAA2CA|nr:MULTISPECIES: hypothetical protein [unclassified Streptomyces]MBT2404732.1 hypothetical protein [Streptomyces sp. ISL-21]MBT2612620.1 hypothetical protein [Streptomyces sp. ISL-87]
MSIRHKVKVRGGAAVAVAAVLSLTLAGCGGGDEKPKEPQKSAPSQNQGSGAEKPAPSGSSSTPVEVIATAKGPAGVVLEINSAERDQDGYLTVSGQLKNTGSQAFVRTSEWNGVEKNASPASVAGATLVDSVGKKRYYVLRDTEGRCACTTGLSRIAAGESVPFFAQFPGPPTTTTEVVFGLPTFATATVKISG